MYRASKFDCSACALKPRCCPNTPARKVPRIIYEGARDMARETAETNAYVVFGRERKKIEMLFAHLKRIVRLDRLRLRGPNGGLDEFLLAATAQRSAASSPNSCRPLCPLWAEASTGFVPQMRQPQTAPLPSTHGGPFRLEPLFR